MIGGRKLVSIPYSYEINDLPFLQRATTRSTSSSTAIKRQFDTLYAEGAHSGRVMAICLHPYLIGVPFRIKGLDDALAYIAAHDEVWFATGSEIVRLGACRARLSESRASPSGEQRHRGRPGREVRSRTGAERDRWKRVARCCPSASTNRTRLRGNITACSSRIRHKLAAMA